MATLLKQEGLELSETKTVVTPVTTESPRPADARHLELFLDTHPRRAKHGFVVCRVARPVKLTRRVTAIPWADL